MVVLNAVNYTFMYLHVRYRQFNDIFSLYCSYPEIKDILNAHTANCLCIEFDPTGRYFATGSADALVSVWDVANLVCVRAMARYTHLHMYK